MAGKVFVPFFGHDHAGLWLQDEVVVDFVPHEEPTEGFDMKRICSGRCAGLWRLRYSVLNVETRREQRRVRLRLASILSGPLSRILALNLPNS